MSRTVSVASGALSTERKGRDNSRVELPPDAARELRAGRLLLDPGAVHAVGKHRLVGVRHRQGLRLQGIF